MALFDGSVEPTEGERQRMKNADGLRKNVKSVEQTSVTAELNDRKYGRVYHFTPSKPEHLKEDPSEQGEPKDTAQRYRERYSHLWSDDTKEIAKQLFKDRD